MFELVLRNDEGVKVRVELKHKVRFCIVVGLEDVCVLVLMSIHNHISTYSNICKFL